MLVESCSAVNPSCQLVLRVLARRIPPAYGPGTHRRIVVMGRRNGYAVADASRDLVSHEHPASVTLAIPRRRYDLWPRVCTVCAHVGLCAAMFLRRCR